MTLNDYLYIYKISVSDFAKLSGYSRGHLSGVLNGKRIPSKDFQEKVKMLTDNKVTSFSVASVFAEVD